VIQPKRIVTSLQVEPRSVNSFLKVAQRNSCCGATSTGPQIRIGKPLLIMRRCARTTCLWGAGQAADRKTKQRADQVVGGELHIGIGRRRARLSLFKGQM